LYDYVLQSSHASVPSIMSGFSQWYIVLLTLKCLCKCYT